MADTADEFHVPAGADAASSDQSRWLEAGTRCPSGQGGGLYRKGSPGEFCFNGGGRNRRYAYACHAHSAATRFWGRIRLMVRCRRLGVMCLSELRAGLKSRMCHRSDDKHRERQQSGAYDTQDIPGCCSFHDIPIPDRLILTCTHLTSLTCIKRVARRNWAGPSVRLPVPERLLGLLRELLVE